MFHAAGPNPPGGGLVTGVFTVVDGSAGSDQTNPHISGDGQWVTYTSDDGINSTVSVFNTVTSTTTPVPSVGPAFLSQISDDANHVVFTEFSGGGPKISDWNPNTPFVAPTDIGSGNQTNAPTVSGDGSVYAYEDFQFNPLESDIVIRTNSVSTQISLPGTDKNPSLSADGNSVVFLNSDTTGLNADVLLFDRSTGILTNISSSLPTNGEEQLSVGDAVSGDGRFVAFTSSSGGERDLFVWDRTTGEATNVTANWSGEVNNAAISEDGRYIAFEGDTGNGQTDIYRADNPLHDDFIM